MSGVASYNVISMYISGLTKYRYTVANLHRLQFGRGAPAPKQPITRIRIDIKQLDHFISFITSPHLVQDLPFGQRHLKLSSGEVIDVPNVIRQIIPQRIVRQYTQYCKETNFKPFGERTMLRILSECSASVRKSLQGLDYFAAEGARAFDDLVGMVHQISENVAGGKEWGKRMTESLKASKLYLKGDFKVIILPLPSRLGVLDISLGEEVPPGPQTLTVLKTKNVRFLIPCLRNLTQNPTPLKIFARKGYPAKN